ncbi:MAG: TetR/AcrR family transcriptional regulator [Actinobacteria bacterium]|jgi:AcrR family transcriptional regulator|nr:MAG: TetR/AcrR family transcriptional regulator [Actinomycetota bacterium]
MEARSSQRGAQSDPGTSVKVHPSVLGERLSRKQQAEETRRRLAETALQLYSSRGYDHVSVDDICREAGVSKGTFYVHFKSKDQVLVEEFLELDRFYLDSLGEIAKIASGVERLIALGRYSLRHLAGLGKDYLKVAFSSQIAPGRGPSPLAAKARASYKVALRLVREAQKRGELRSDLSSEEITLALVRAIRGIVFEWCLLDGRFDLEQAGETLLKILIDGLNPR